MATPVADGLNGPDQGNDNERWQQRPELGIRLQVESWPRPEGNAGPRSVQYLLGVVQAEGRGHRAAHHYPDDRRP